MWFMWPFEGFKEKEKKYKCEYNDIRKEFEN